MSTHKAKRSAVAPTIACCPACGVSYLCGADTCLHCGTPQLHTNARTDSSHADRNGPWRRGATGNRTIGLLGVAALIGISSVVQMKMNGPEFLAFYALFFFAALITNVLCPTSWFDSKGITLLAFLAFEGMGVVRLLYALSIGMQRFEAMIIGMVVGGLILSLPLMNRGGGSGGDGGGWFFFGGCGGGGCGGGCGGGGCGGGGCGRCGG